MEGKENKNIWIKLINNPITTGVLSNIIVMAIIYFFSVYNIIPTIKETNYIVKQLKTDISQIKDNYLLKDTEGIEVKVGINSELDGNNVTVFKNNKVGLQFTNAFFATNPINSFYPTIKLLVSCEIDKDGDKSEAEIFISKEASEILGLIKNKKQGIYKLKIKILDQKE